MENLIYSSNSSNSILKDLGPYKQQSSDDSLFGFISTESEQVTKSLIFGQRIEILPKIIINSFDDFVEQQKSKEHQEQEQKD